MDWLKNRLRAWLCPELNSSWEKPSRVIQEDAVKKSSSVPYHEHQQVPLWALESDMSKRMAVILNILKHVHKNHMKEMDEQMKVLWMSFPGKKRIPIKAVLMELLDHLELEVSVYGKPGQEMSPGIESKMYRFTEEQ